jgi:glycosyltransferase involved in cell wall biosynthesis
MKTVAFLSPQKTNTHRGIGFYAQRLLAELMPKAGDYNLKIVTDPASADLIHYSYFDLFQHSLPILTKCPRVVTIFDVIPLEYPEIYRPGIKGSLNLFLQKLSLTQTSSIISISQASIVSIHKYLEVPHSKIFLTHLAADPQFHRISSNSQLMNIKKKYNLPLKFVLYVGGINFNKNLPNLFIACQKINLPLVIVGKEAVEVDSLDTTHPELSHLSSINWSKCIRLGFVPTLDLVCIYNLATVYCQPSFSEGFGLNILEALSCGTPVALSEIPVFREIVEDNGHFFDPHNIFSITQALISAQNTRPKPINPKFSWSNTADLTLKVYKTLLK